MGGFAFGFVLFPVVFVVIFGLIAFIIAKAIAAHREEEEKNDRSPVVTAPARVTSKRASVTSSDSSTSTTYYVTFEFQEGTRIEFHVDGREYGMIAEGDKGDITFQGTRYIGFSRK